MSVSLKVRASGVLAAVAFATVLSVVPAQAFALPPLPVVQGAIASATLTADEAGLATGPAAPGIDLIISTLGAIAVATAPVWVPWVADQIHNLTDSGHAAGPVIKSPAQVAAAPAPPVSHVVHPPVLTPSPITKDTPVTTSPRVSMVMTTDGSFVSSSADMVPVIDYRLTCQDASSGAVTFKTGKFYSANMDAQTSGGTHAGYPTSASAVADCPGSTPGPNIPVQATFGPASNTEWTASGTGSAGVVPDMSVSWVNPSPPVAPAGSAAAAPKVITTNVHCIGPDGTTFDVSADVDATAGGFTVPSCAASVPGAHSLTTTVSEPHFAGDPAPANIFQTSPLKNATYPGCDPTLAGPLCVLSLKVDGTPCVVGAAPCQGWTSLVTSAPSRLECDWGTYTVPLADCDVLERAFEPTAVPATTANTDGNPSTWDGTAPSTDPSPSPSAAPVPGFDPGVQPSTAPSAGEGTGTGNLPGAGSNPNVDASNGGQNCYPVGWSAFNPVEWVMMPVECALSWAFVPQAATVADLQDGVNADVQRVGFGPIDDAVTAGLAPLGSSGGCAGPTFNFDFEGTHTSIQPLNACSGGMAVAAGVVYAFTTLLFIAGGGFVFLRAIGSAFGYNFSIGPKNTGDA